jgi:MoaA/NifB/PqqE/SkfB family radical SAM enzyme
MSRFCTAPWLNIEVSMLGTARVCCHIGINAKDDEGAELTYGKNSVEEIFGSSSFKELRRDFLEGKEPEACRGCWASESYGRVSSRQNWAVAAKSLGVSEEELITSGEDPSFGPRSFSLHPGNICSLACRMCNPVKSSRIAADKVATEWSDKLPGLKGKREQLEKYRAQAWWRRADTVQPIVDALPAGPKRLFLAGGEPFMTSWAIAYVESLARREDSSEIILQIFTNGSSMLPNPDILSRFGRVLMNVSIEAIGNANGYIRDRSDWATVEANVALLHQIEKVKVVLSPSLQIYNILSITDVLRWGFERGLCSNIGYVDSPYYLSVLGAPAAMREEAAARLDALINEYSAHLLDGESPFVATLNAAKVAARRLRNPPPGINPEVRMQTFLKFNQALDTKRGQSFQEVLPELFAWLKAYELLQQQIETRISG